MFFQLYFQAFHFGCFGLAGGVARRGHETPSRAAYLLWGCLHVGCAYIPLVSTQVSGEFYHQSLNGFSYCRADDSFERSPCCLSRDLSLMSFAETMDNIWPFEPHLLRNYQKHFLTPTCGVMETPWFKSSANTFSSSFVFRWCGGQSSGVWACSSALAFLS